MNSADVSLTGVSDVSVTSQISQEQQTQFLMGTDGHKFLVSVGVGCTHYKLLKITSAYLFPLRVVGESSLGIRRFVVFVLLTPRFQSVDDAWQEIFWPNGVVVHV